MHCLLISATAFEIAPFLENFRNGNGIVKDGLAVDVLISGIGLLASTYKIARQVSIKKPDVMVQAGIAGCFNRKMPLGTVVAVKQERVADLGVFEDKSWKTLFDLGLEKKSRVPYSNEWLVNRSPLLSSIKLPKVKSVSVNEITTSPKKIKTIKESFNPVSESLEGAALHYVAISEGIPFVQIRALSNYIGERDKRKWEMTKAINNLNGELKKLLLSLNPG